jgi:hypothetical protein
VDSTTGATSLLTTIASGAITSACINLIRSLGILSSMHVFPLIEYDTSNDFIVSVVCGTGFSFLFTIVAVIQSSSAYSYII